MRSFPDDAIADRYPYGERQPSAVDGDEFAIDGDGLTVPGGRPVRNVYVRTDGGLVVVEVRLGGVKGSHLHEKDHARCGQNDQR